MYFQDLIMTLENYWKEKGAIIMQPYDTEKGAGTMNPNTFLRSLGPEEWKVVYVEPSRRPADGRYGENPNRLYQHHQLQVILKPSPEDVQQLYLDSLFAIGIDPKKHDIRFVEDNWESPTLGAWGLGWEVWLDGMEITQFTYFQQVGGIPCELISGEITYGLERLAMYLQDIDNVYDIVWDDNGGHKVLYGDVHKQSEFEFSKYNFELADTKMLFTQFDNCFKECKRVLEQKYIKDGIELDGLALPAYDYCMLAAHTFNVLDARGAISVTQRQDYILKIRELAKGCALAYSKNSAKISSKKDEKGNA